MSDLFTIDCHACGAKNTIDRETMRRVAPSRDERTIASINRALTSTSTRVAEFVVHLGSPEPAGDSDWPEDAA